MNNAPLFYIPTQPESNGLTLPMLLSLLAHGIVLGLLIYTYQTPTLDTAGAIETTVVTPEQLAELQGQILSNRAAAAEAASSASSDSATETFDNSSFSSDISELSEPSSQRVPVFMRSEEVADEYDATMQAFNRRMEQEAADRIEAPRKQQRQLYIEQQETLTELKEVEKNPPPKTPTKKNPMVSKSSRGDITVADSSSMGNETMNLESDGEPKSFATANNTGSSSRSSGDFKKGIADKIQRNLNAPVETQGITARVALKLDNRGNVLSAKANGSNDAVNKAAEKAALAASPLPIDPNNPASFSDLIINITVK